MPKVDLQTRPRLTRKERVFRHLVWGCVLLVSGLWATALVALLRWLV